MVFHLQTRQPTVLPPLCALCGCGAADTRPMQEGASPDWRLLSVRACRRRSALKRSLRSSNSLAAPQALFSRCCRPSQPGPRPVPRSLQVACDRLSQLSRGGGPGGGNSETLLELLASFFGLYEALLAGGWAAPKGADAGALRR